MQALNIIFLGDQSGKGTFFPEGILGKINTPKGFDELASGTENFPIWPKKAPQVFTSFYLADQFSALWFCLFGPCLWQDCIKLSGLTRDFYLLMSLSKFISISLRWEVTFPLSAWQRCYGHTPDLQLFCSDSNNGFDFCR